MTLSPPSSDLRALLRGSGSLVVLTGAGVSAESGLATFRGPEGLWQGRDPMELASADAFRRDPLTVWRFYDWRRRQAARATPNAAHRALSALDTARERFALVTQNVDGLHERAGSRRVVRLHGTLWRLRCTEDGREFDDTREDLGPLPPRCECGALLRPAVVWFGESLPEAALAGADRAVREAVLVLVVGTSSRVYPAAALPAVARQCGAYVVEINPESTPLSEHVDERLVGRAAEVVPRLVHIAGIDAEPS